MSIQRLNHSPFELLSYLIEFSENRFRDTNCLSPRDASHSFGGIRLLGLNATLLSWDEVGVPVIRLQSDAHIHISR